MPSSNEALIARARAAGRRNRQDNRGTNHWVIMANQAALENQRGAMTKDQWFALVGFCRGCVCCGDDTEPLVPDHILAKSKGGSDSISNRQPMCVPCNSTKGARDWPDMRPEGWQVILTLLHGTETDEERAARKRWEAREAARSQS